MAFLQSIRYYCGVSNLMMLLLAVIFSTAAGLSKRTLELSDGPHKEKTTKVVFIKTHETGSSTLTGIMHRFCDSNGVDCFVHPPSMSAFRTIGPGELKSLREQTSQGTMHHFDVFASHSFFVPEDFEQMVPGGVKMSIFREPRTRTVASLSKRKTGAEIQQVLTDLQANVEVEPTHPCGVESMLMSTQVPAKYMDDLDFVLLTDKYDLGLVLLRRRLHWSTHDIMYAPMKVQVLDDDSGKARDALDAYLAGKSGTLTSAAEHVVEHCIEPENKLYNEAQIRFKKQLSELTPKEQEAIKMEVIEFQETLKLVQACCEKTEHDPYCATLKVDNLKWTRDKHAQMLLGRKTSCAALVNDWEHKHGDQATPVGK